MEIQILRLFNTTLEAGLTSAIRCENSKSNYRCIVCYLNRTRQCRNDNLQGLPFGVSSFEQSVGIRSTKFSQNGTEKSPRSTYPNRAIQAGDFNGIYLE